MTQYPLRLVLHSLDASQRVMKWGLELDPYGLAYQPCTTIKAQTLEDFVTDITSSLNNTTIQPKSSPEVAEHIVAAPAPHARDFWCLHVDGSSNYQGLGTCLVLTTPDGSMLE
ncbi:hypothetical protein ACFX11_025684 [Malus domestica]